MRNQVHPTKQPPVEYTLSNSVYPTTPKEQQWVEDTSQLLQKRIGLEEITDELQADLAKTYPGSTRIIRHNDTPIGYQKIFPASYELMHAYLEGTINTTDLLRAIQHENLSFAHASTTFWNEAFIESKYQQQGIATRVGVEAFDDLDIPKHASIFTESTTLAGTQTAKKIADSTNKQLYLKEDIQFVLYHNGKIRES